MASKVISGMRWLIKPMPKSDSPVKTLCKVWFIDSSMTRMRIEGYLAEKLRMTCGKKYSAAEGTQATVTRPLRVAAMSEMPSMADSRSSMAERARSKKTRPKLVNSTSRVVRLNKRVPMMDSNFSIRRLSAGGDK